MKFADLHIHTTFSDGSYTPQEIVRASVKQGVSAISIVDHDTVEGIDLTIDTAKNENIEVIPGRELSTDCDGLEVHILGYFIDYKNEHLLAKLDSLRKIRIQRLYKILNKLSVMGINLDADSVFDIANKATVGRLHIAQAMLKQGIVGSIPEAFQKYIGNKCPAYVCGFGFSPLEAIRLIKDITGIPVLAHPYSLKRDELIPQFVNYGLMGLEVYYPEHSQAMINFYLGLAREYNLLITGGSDYHGEVKSGVNIGMINFPYELVERLKQARDKQYENV